MSPFPILGVPGVPFSFYSILLANSEDPDHTPRSAASDLGLHCLPRSPKRDAGLIWVKYVDFSTIRAKKFGIFGFVV